jgi:hypothetical protein
MIWVHKHFFQSKIVLDILKGVEDVDKAKEKEEIDLEEEVVTASTGQPIDRMKQTSQSITLTMTI